MAPRPRCRRSGRSAPDSEVGGRYALDMRTRAPALARSMALLAAFLLAPAGCAPEQPDGGGGGTDGGGDGDDEGDSIDGDYTLSASTGWEPVPGTNVRISFDGAAFGFSAGCNSYFGEYTVFEGAFLVDGLGSTEIGCDAELHEQDQWLADFFDSGPTIAHAAPRVVFTTDTVSLTFLEREIAEPDLPLVGTYWNIDTLIDGEVAVGGFGYDAALSFADDHTFSIDGPCNTIAGDYAVRGAALMLSQVSATEAGCSDPDQADFEAHLRDVFAAGTVICGIDVNRLSIDRDDLGVRALAE